MDIETQAIVNAIAALKPNEKIDWLMEVIFPVSMAFFSALMGGYVGFLAYTRQERFRFEKEKMDVANRWMLLAEGALQTMITLKSNYHKSLQDHPFQRTVVIPHILFKAEPVVGDYSLLSFLAPKADEDSEPYPKWSQVPMIQNIFGNYNNLLAQWELRNKLCIPIREGIIMGMGPDGFADVNNQNILDHSDTRELITLVDITEHCIVMTDHLLIQFSDFMKNFPKHASTKIKVKQLKNYGTLLTYAGARHQNPIFELCTAPNLAPVARYFGKTVEELKERYKTGYEHMITDEK